MINLFLYCYNFIKAESIPNSIKYINENFTEDIDLKKLATIEHFNVNYYCEWFKNHMNMTPIEYIQKQRINKAKELLLNTYLSILQIAQMVGYEHHSSFTRVFKNLEIISPSKYRNNSLK